jgi:hypothetical protein
VSGSRGKQTVGLGCPSRVGRAGVESGFRWRGGGVCSRDRSGHGEVRGVARSTNDRGRARAPDLGIVTLDETTSLARAFGAINSWAARPGRLHTVFVLCHGKAGLEDEEQQRCRLAGGSGLTLGKEKVLHSNVHMWRAIRGKVANIVVYSCRAAMTASQDIGSIHDGRYLMGALALHTQATVYASNEIQYSNRYHGLLHGRIEIVPWQGTLLAFPPTGGSPAQVRRAPRELGEAMRGL